MLSKIFTASLIGLDCNIVEVEVEYKRGNNYFSIVGLADKSIQEAKDRIPAAIRNSSASFIPMSIVINLAPAQLIKSGPSYDLPLALGFLIASEQISIDTKDKLFIGELALDGKLRSVKGILPITDSAKRLGFKEIYLPSDNAREASVVKGIKVYSVENLKQLINHFNGVELIEPEKENEFQITELTNSNFDLSQVKGQEFAKRALEIAAAGGHNILLSGVPGSGKTMLSRCLPTILPKLEVEEALEVTRIHSVAGFTSKQNPIITSRPFRSPHHTSSQVALVGGGAFPKPGEISLAHRGILFLDEFPEFSTQALEALRQPLEDKVVTISRAQGTLTFPANFILVAAMNPCKCGFRGDPVKNCTCSPMDVIRYQKKISGPILDRIDLLIRVPKVENEKLFSFVKSESSQMVRDRIQDARNLQIARFKGINLFCNSDMSQKDIDKFIVLDKASENIAKLAINRMNLSARSYYRLLKVSRTIADLRGSEKIEERDITEALAYRIEIGG